MAPSTRKKLLAALAGVGLSLAAAEVVVRATFGVPRPERLPIMEMLPHPTRGWSMVPGQDHYTYLERVSVNSLGLRGPEVAPEHPGRVRVLALGDSLTYGQGVGDDETLPAYLEGFLNELDPEHRSWEVVNGGHRAYDTRQEVAMAEELAPLLRPDVVIVFWYWNDIMERDVQGTFERLSAKGGPVAFDTGDPVEGWSAVRWHARQLLRRSALVMLAYDLLRGPRNAPIGEPVRAGGMKRLARHLDRLLALAGEQGFEPWFVLLPDANLVAGQHDSEEVAVDAARLAREKGLHVEDLLAPMRAYHRETGRVPVIPYDGHYLPEGNRVLARATAEALLGLARPGGGGKSAESAEQAGVPPGG